MNVGKWSLAAFLALGLLICGGVEADVSRIEPGRAHELAKAGKILLIDVRSLQEWRRSGLPRGASPITIHQPRRDFYEKVLAASAGDKSKSVALICAAGVRSRRASEILTAAGFSQVYDVTEGMEGSGAGLGWRRRGLPLEPLGSGRCAGSALEC